jgi:hypothetical protein
MSEPDPLPDLLVSINRDEVNRPAWSDMARRVRSHDNAEFNRLRAESERLAKELAAARPVLDAAVMLARQYEQMGKGSVSGVDLYDKLDALYEAVSDWQEADPTTPRTSQ